MTDLATDLATDLGEGPVAVRAARSFVRDSLTAWDPDQVDVVLLLVNELVTNAALHAGGPIHLRLRRRVDAVRIEVHDTSRRLPQRRRALDLERVSGRGMHLVHQLSRRHGADATPDGKLVWCEVGLTGQSGSGPHA